ncbi:hypothetical protein BC834DRAFT_44814 [Gloeopeniophorella convolvens]|nr:hypothetical protein BC834DRAFT_44814 [Gloeopeniophorella convolvens]
MNTSISPPRSSYFPAITGASPGLLGSHSVFGINPAQRKAPSTQGRWFTNFFPNANSLLTTVFVWCMQSAFVKWSQKSTEDFTSISLIAFLLGNLILSLWSTLMAIHRALEEMSKRIDAINDSAKSVGLAANSPVTAVPEVTDQGIQATEPEVPETPEPEVPEVKEQETHEASVPQASEVIEQEVPEAAASDARADVQEAPAHTHEESPKAMDVAVQTVAEDTPKIEMQNSQPGAHEQATIEDSGERVDEFEYIDTPTVLLEAPAVDVPSPAVDPTPVTDIVSVEDVQVERPASSPEPTSISRRRLDFPDMKEFVMGLAGAVLNRVARSDDGQAIRASAIEQTRIAALRRAEISLLLPCASLSTADFASPEGYFTSSSAIYCPTGNPSNDGDAAFTKAMDCFDALDALGSAEDKTELAARAFNLTQALSDLGFHDFALDASEQALAFHRENHERGLNASRVEFAALLSLRARILGEVGRRDEAVEAASEAVALLKAHEEFHGSFVPDLPYAVFRYAVLLGAVGQADEATAVAFELTELLNGRVDSQPDMRPLLALAQLCLAQMSRGSDNETALAAAEKAVELSRTQLGADSRGILGGALLVKAQLLSSQAQDDVAHASSNEAVSHLRSISADRRTYSLILASALFTHSRLLSKVERGFESFTLAKDAVELYQELHTSAPRPLARQLAYALHHLAKFCPADKKRADLADLQLAQSAVDVFRTVQPFDCAGLGDALYLYAVRLLELDKNEEAATYAEEAVQHFRDARNQDPDKYSLDLLCSLSLASSSLACTPRAEAALEYAKEAVELQRGRKGSLNDPIYKPHLQKLLGDVVMRLREMEMDDEEMLPWVMELQGLEGHPGDDAVTPAIMSAPQPRRSGRPRGSGNMFQKETNVRLDLDNATAPPQTMQSVQGLAASPSLTSSYLSSPPPGAQDSFPAPLLDKGKGKAPDVSASKMADEEIYTPGSMGQRKLPGMGLMDFPVPKSMLGDDGSGLGGIGKRANEPLRMGGMGGPGSGGMYGLGAGGMGALGAGGMGGFGGLEGFGGMGGMGSMGAGGFDSEALLGAGPFGSGGRQGPGRTLGGKVDAPGGGAQPKRSPQPSKGGSWSGSGIQSRLSDDI